MTSRCESDHAHYSTANACMNNFSGRAGVNFAIDASFKLYITQSNSRTGITKRSSTKMARFCIKSPEIVMSGEQVLLSNMYKN